MRSFVLFACLVVSCACANPAASGALQDPAQPLQNQEQASLPMGRNPNARMLSTFTQTIKDNTGAAVTQLDSVISAAESINGVVSDIKTTVESSSAALVADVTLVKDTITGDLLTKLGSLDESVQIIEAAIPDSTFQQSLLAQLTEILGVVDEKLSGIENLLGFEGGRRIAVKGASTDTPVVLV